MRQLKDNPLFRHLDLNHVGIVGSSIGSNTALAGSQMIPDKVHALVLLSPGLDYKGITTSIPIVKYKNPVMIVASEQDPYAFESSQLLYKWAIGDKAVRLYDNIGHGTDMLHFYPKLQDEVTTWLNKYLQPGKVAIQTEASEETAHHDDTKSGVSDHPDREASETASHTIPMHGEEPHQSAHHDTDSHDEEAEDHTTSKKTRDTTPQTASVGSLITGVDTSRR